MRRILIIPSLSDTTSNAINTFTLAMITYPAALEAAQAELDRVCGTQVPTFDDFERLPYIRAMCKETLRWRPVAAGGLHFHGPLEDSTYVLSRTA